MAAPVTGTAQIVMDDAAHELTGGTLGVPAGTQLTLSITAGAADIYIGFANTVTTGTGHKIPAGGGYDIAVPPLKRVWAIGAASTITVLRNVY